jgi:hypothetical protein
MARGRKYSTSEGARPIISDLWLLRLRRHEELELEGIQKEKDVRSDLGNAARQGLE